MLNEIRELITSENAQAGKEHITNSGTTLIYLKPQYVRDLWSKAKLRETSLESFVISLSNEPRKAFLETLIKAEGEVHHEVVQNVGGVLRAASLAFFMEGYYPRISNVSRPGYPLGRSVFGARPTITAQRLSSRSIEPGPVWCIETDYHSWVVQDSRSEGDKIFITGNTIYGGGATEDRMRFYKAYPRAAKYMHEVEDMALYGYRHRIRTRYGRYREILDSFVPEPHKITSPGGREALSTVDQGSSAEEIKAGMIRIWNYIKNTDIKMLLQVHDELVFEVPTNQVEYLKQLIAHTIPTNVEISTGQKVPIRVSIEVGDSWGQMEKVAKGVTYSG